VLVRSLSPAARNHEQTDHVHIYAAVAYIFAVSLSGQKVFYRYLTSSETLLLMVTFVVMLTPVTLTVGLETSRWILI